VWEEPYEWSPRELITAAKLNITARNLKWLKQRLEALPLVHDKTCHKSPVLPDDDVHRTAVPLDHPNGSVTTEKIADGAITPAKVVPILQPSGLGYGSRPSITTTSTTFVHVTAADPIVNFDQLGLDNWVLWCEKTTNCAIRLELHDINNVRTYTPELTMTHGAAYIAYSAPFSLPSGTRRVALNIRSTDGLSAYLGWAYLSKTRGP